MSVCVFVSVSVSAYVRMCVSGCLGVCVILTLIGFTLSCLQGDSGGPLVCRNPKNNWVQVGVASFTSPSGGSPGVFTSVSDHYDWIITTIEGHSRDN